MGRGILIIGESGTGKSTSIEKLNPLETFIINVQGKDLPIKGYKRKYTLWSGENPSGNYYVSDDSATILKLMTYISEKRPEIKQIIIDDYQYTMANEYMRKSDVKGFDKFTQIAKNAWLIANKPKELRNDLMVFFLTHAEENTDLDGNRRLQAKTIGKMLTNTITLEGMFTVVLYTKVKKNKEGNMEYVFTTQNDGGNTCKAPKDMFTSKEIPNDLSLVIEKIVEYEESDELIVK
jgi:energy-coupling factor transporter ATP-binding protein EcfA2